MTSSEASGKREEAKYVFVDSALGNLNVIGIHNYGWSLTMIVHVMQFLRSRCELFYYIRNDINDVNKNDYIFSEVYVDGRLSQKERTRRLSLPFPLRILLSATRTLLYIVKLKRRFHIVIVGDEFSASLAVLLRALKITKIVIFYSIDYYPNRFANPLYQIIYRTLENKFIPKCQLVWCISRRSMKARAKQMGDAHKCILVHHGASPLLSRHFQIADRKKLILYVGTLTWEKGLQLAITGMKHVLTNNPDAQLLVVGDGPDKQRLQTMTKDLGLSDFVHFYGFVSDKELEEIYSRSKVGINLAMTNDPLSYTFYAFPGKILDYISHGLPVITTQNELSELVSSSKAGLVIEADSKAFARAVSDLLEMDLDSYFLMCQNALKLSEDFDRNRIIYNAIYETLTLLSKKDEL